jgi:hypothetical protein
MSFHVLIRKKGGVRIQQINAYKKKKFQSKWISSQRCSYVENTIGCEVGWHVGNVAKCRRNTYGSLQLRWFL